MQAERNTLNVELLNKKKPGTVGFENSQPLQAVIPKLRDGCGKDHIQGTVTKISKGKTDYVAVKLLLRSQ